MRVEESIEIGRPLKEVFDYVSEPDTFPERREASLGARSVHVAQQARHRSPVSGRRTPRPPGTPGREIPVGAARRLRAVEAPLAGTRAGGSIEVRDEQG